MENDFDEDSLLAAVNGMMKIGVKTTENTLKIHRSIGDELKDSSECSAMLDVSMISAAFRYYRYKKETRNRSLDTSNLLDDNLSDNYGPIKETDFTLLSNNLSNLSNSLEKALPPLQIDTDLISESPKIDTDFLNLYRFVEDQLESVDLPGNPSTFLKIKTTDSELSNSTIVNFERNKSYLNEKLKSLDCECTEIGTVLETSNESFETISKYSASESQLSEANGPDNSILRFFHNEGYFPEELDYEPSEVGEENSEGEFGINNELEDKGSDCLSNYYPQDTTLDEGVVNEVDKPEDYTKICDGQNLMSLLQSEFELKPGKNRLENNDTSFEYEDDDESESDNEHSFKRDSSRNRQARGQETLHQPLINSDISKVNQLNSLNEALLYICEHCQSGNINEAITIANKYIATSAEPAQIEIFKELFTNTMNLIKSSDPLVYNISISKSLREIMSIFHQSKLFDSNLCSLIINQCFDCDYTIDIGVKFFSFIQKIKVPVHSNAINSYVDVIISEDIPSLELILFLEYVKGVCNLPCPRALLCKVLNHYSKQEECFLVGFLRLCKFLRSISSREVDMSNLQSFIEYCIKNDCWSQIASFFQAWYKDGHLISCLACSFLCKLKEVGTFYEKFAEEVYKHNDMSLYLVGILGQIGVSLMLEVSSKKQYESAFRILFTLHKRNINYMELQSCLYNAPNYLRSLPEFTDIFVFPFTVAFAALDICFHLRRFKDAYRVFKGFSLKLPDYMEDKMKLKVRSQRFGYLLKLTRELYSLEPLKLGLQAFNDICLAAKDFSLQEFDGFAGEIQVIYNKYLTYVINGCQLHTALELFEYSEGPLKRAFVVYPRVLRSLLVTFAQNDKMEEANKFFSLGCMRKVYNMEQTKREENVWTIIIRSSWTIFEMQFVIKSFIKDISLAWNKTGSCVQLSALILFEESKEDCSEIDCLKKSHSVDTAKEIACDVLKSLDTNIKWVESKNPICLKLVPETIYNCCINTSPDFLWMKKTRKNVLEDTRSNTEFGIESYEENLGHNQSAESNSVKSLNKVLGQLTPEYSVADSSDQFITDKNNHLSLTPSTTHMEINRHELPVTTTLENTHNQTSDFVLSSSEQEQIISSSNLLSPNAHSSTITLEREAYQIDTAESISTASEKTNKWELGKKIRRIPVKTKGFKSSSQYTSKKIVLKTLKWRKNYKRICSKKGIKRNLSVTKEVVMVPQETAQQSETSEIKNVLQNCEFKPLRVKNYQVTLKSSAQNGESRSVSKLQGTQVIIAKPNDIKNELNVPEIVFQKIVLFLRSKVLIKCKDLQPQQQEEKAIHLATLFIQNHIIHGLDRKTMKLLNEFAGGHL